MRALIVVLVAWHAVAAAHGATLGLLNVDLLVEPEHLPKFVCVLTADPPKCRDGQSCSVAIDRIRSQAPGASGEVDVAPAADWQSLGLPNGSALEGALQALASSPDLKGCEDDAACPRSLTIRDHGRYLSCAANQATTGSLVAVMELTGTLTRIVGMAYEGSHVLVNTEGPVGTVWVTPLGGHFATGLSQQALQVGKRLSASIPLTKRCRERTIQLPVGDKNVEHLAALHIRESGHPLLTCDPKSFAENSIIVQMPIGREGIVRTLSVQPEDKSWEATTTWSSRAPPETLKLWWKQLSFDVRPDCVLPAPVAVGQPDACPEVSVPGAQRCDKQIVGDVCRYLCTAVTGGAIVTPAAVAFSYGGMEWTDVLAAAFSTIAARPPPDIRRLYFSTINVEELEAIELSGPRGFEQRIQRDDLEREGHYAWVSMPGLQCNDTVSYVYEGRFRHGEQQQRLTAYPVLTLAPLEDTWHYPISVYLGGGASVTELGRPAPYLAFGAHVGGPFGGRYFDWLGLRHRFDSGVRLVWHLAAELQLTYRLYDPQFAPVPPGNSPYTVVMQRQLVWLGIGYDGFRNSPSLIRTLAPSGGYLRVGLGQAIPIHKEDRAVVGNNDIIMAVQAIFHRRFSRRISGEGAFGLLFGETVRDYRRSMPGSPPGSPIVVVSDSHVRFFYGFQLSVTP